MKVTRKFKRDNGDTVCVEMSVSEYSLSKLSFNTSVSLTLKGKRKPVWDSSTCSFGEDHFGWKYRSMNLDEREQARKQIIMQYVTIEELREVRDELLETLRTDNYKF